MTKRETKSYVYIGFIVIVLILLIAFISSPTFNETLTRRLPPGENIPLEILNRPFYHAHADFKIFLDGKEFSFNKSSFDVSNRYIHLHLSNPDGDNVIHMEGMENITLKIFFDSLNITFNASCFITDAEESYCNNFEKRIKSFINGKENLQFDFYEPRNLDRILITYGNETDENIMKQVENVTDYACIYSNRCPERIAELPVLESELIF